MVVVATEEARAAEMAVGCGDGGGSDDGGGDSDGGDGGGGECRSNGMLLFSFA